LTTDDTARFDDDRLRDDKRPAAAAALPLLARLFRSTQPSRVPDRQPQTA
jgi:hypothetical protein